MLDFIIVSTKNPKRGLTQIYPKFIIKNKSDLMIRGGDFYAVWDNELGLWSTKEEDALYLIDKELDEYYEKHKETFGENHVQVLHMWDADSLMIDKWHKYVQKQMRDNYHSLNNKIIFSNTEANKLDYASIKLPYSLEQTDYNAYDELISTLYSEEERHKIEWCIGSIVNGDSKIIHKFAVLYGASGTGKSTILNIIQLLFEGYCATFNAKALGSSTNQFNLEAFKNEPLVAIQHDGDLSRIEDNTTLNSLVSHEEMTVNEKHKSLYTNRFNAFLFMGTNKPVMITDAKSGLIRRLIDITPTGNKIPKKRYDILMNQIKFELGGIAYHCKLVYESDKNYYDNYVATNMLGASNDFYNFIMDSYDIFKTENDTTLKRAWEMYRNYCEEANVKFPFSQRAFKEELKNYFKTFQERANVCGVRTRNVYFDFLSNKFEFDFSKSHSEETSDTLGIIYEKSIFDDQYGETTAQLANDSGTPTYIWDNVKTKLKDLDTSKLHYVLIPENNHIVIDFDIKDSDGKKSLEKNIKAASKWPPTYAELSQGGSGIHLHYIYKGDVTELSSIFDKDIEIKVFSGKSSLRRRLTLCNNKPISIISGGLPIKVKKKMIDTKEIKDENHLRNKIKCALEKKVHPEGTKPNVDYIFTVLEDAYNSGMQYDVENLKPVIFNFCQSSSNQSDYCIKLFERMHFKSDENDDTTKNKLELPNAEEIIFYDVEVFPNLFLVNFINLNSSTCTRWINPAAEQIEQLLKFKLVGFNNRRYDNHILWAAMMGYNTYQLYMQSQRIIKKSANAFFGRAYNISYTDLYDLSSKKQSLKKWEIELRKLYLSDPEKYWYAKDLKHHELGLRWDEPVPEKLWAKVAEYCDDDVLATRALWHHLQSDFKAREILADIAGASVNDTTNSLTTKIIFGNDKNPQRQFNYRFLGDPCKDKPYFEGYTFENGKSFYLGEEVGEGGYVYSKPGMYSNVWAFDIGSMHPTSLIEENHFGKYTKNFSDLKLTRMLIKHGELEKAKTLLDGKLKKHLENGVSEKDLAYALKIAINSVYGLTSANFANPFKDPRNIDNFVAKRGALFMMLLKHEVEELGGNVVHIKTDCIKVENPNEEIKNYICKRGKDFGYDFEIEHIFSKFLLANDAVYIGFTDKDDPEDPEKWVAVGTEFQRPYIFKTLFTKEPLNLADLCETKSVSTAMYIDYNEDLINNQIADLTAKYPNIKIPIDCIYDVAFDEKLLRAIARQAGYVKVNEPIVLNDMECDSYFCKPDFDNMKFKDLYEINNFENFIDISKLHNRVFIGKVGEFLPVANGHKGGILLREKDGKYYAVGGTKGFRWMDSESIMKLNPNLYGEIDNDIWNNLIDKEYYRKMLDSAVSTIKKFGDLELFVN